MQPTNWFYLNIMVLTFTKNQTKQCSIIIVSHMQHTFGGLNG